MFSGTLVHVDVRPCTYCQSNGKVIEIDSELKVAFGSTIS